MEIFSFLKLIDKRDSKSLNDFKLSLQTLQQKINNNKVLTLEYEGMSNSELDYHKELNCSDIDFCESIEKKYESLNKTDLNALEYYYFNVDEFKDTLRQIKEHAIETQRKIDAAYESNPNTEFKQMLEKLSQDPQHLTELARNGTLSEYCEIMTPDELVNELIRAGILEKLTEDQLEELDNIGKEAAYNANKLKKTIDKNNSDMDKINLISEKLKERELSQQEYDDMNDMSHLLEQISEFKEKFKNTVWDVQKFEESQQLIQKLQQYIYQSMGNINIKEPDESIKLAYELSEVLYCIEDIRTLCHNKIKNASELIDYKNKDEKSKVDLLLQNMEIKNKETMLLNEKLKLCVNNFKDVVIKYKESIAKND